MPVLTYILRHFLLTLPILRDEVDDQDRSTFWLDGLQPILQTLYESDLSRAVDRLESEPTRHAPLAGTVERFVSSGLKVRPGAIVDTPVPASLPPMPAFPPTRVEAMSRAKTEATNTEVRQIAVLDIPAKRLGAAAGGTRKKLPFWKRALGFGKSTTADEPARPSARDVPRLTARAPRTGMRDAGGTALVEADALLAALSASPESHEPVPISRAPTLPRIDLVGPLQPHDVGLSELSEPSAPRLRDSVLSTDTYLTAPDLDPSLQTTTPRGPWTSPSEPHPTSPRSEQAANGFESRPAEPPFPITDLAPAGPRDSPVDLHVGPSFSTVRWGGFEVDVVGVRKHLLSHVRSFRPTCSDTALTRLGGRATCCASAGPVVLTTMSFVAKRPCSALPGRFV